MLGAGCVSEGTLLVIDGFLVKLGLGQGCAMSLWLFNVYMEGVFREVYARVMGQGLELL